MANQGTVEIAGITYRIVTRRDADQEEAAGYPNVARVMRENRIRFSFNLQRPRGKKFYSACQWESGTFSTVVTLF